MSEKFGNSEAWQIVRPLALALEQVCERVEIVGSIRRKRPLVKDAEILYIPRFHDSKEDLFAETPQNLADDLIAEWLKAHLLEKRLSVLDRPAWGAVNKLARHVASGLPIDFFATTKLNWWNSLVVRTGGQRSNVAIASAARQRGWTLEAYGAGFHKINDAAERHDCDSEQDVFRFVGLPYLPPEDRL